MPKLLTVALVAGEASGDILGAGLMQALKAQHADIQFVGVGGPLMEAQGLVSYFPMERLAVMGLVEVLGRLRELLKRRKDLLNTLLSIKPDVFIGIDAPDFNLDLELKLRNSGIKTVHYVSPSVWAWRQKRVFKIQKACDLMLTLLPFEAKFYQEHQVPVCFVGHPLANSIDLEPQRQQARQLLTLEQDGEYVALMPGSRGGEVERLGNLFLDTASELLKQRPQLKFLLPAANELRFVQLESMLKQRNLPVVLLEGQSQAVLEACNVVLIASGTATLEALLFKRPMVVAYKLAGLTYWILRKMVRSPYISLPNLLAGKMLVPEVLQDQATPEKLAEALLPLLNDGTEQTRFFADIHQVLRRNASETAAAAVLELIG